MHDATRPRLKLRAAEDNLARLDDVTATLAAQSETLRKQARQATRYRRLGEQIREAEARLLHVRWRQAIGEADRLAVELREAERDLAVAGEDALLPRAGASRSRGRTAAAASAPIRGRRGVAAAWACARGARSGTRQGFGGARRGRAAVDADRRRPRPRDRAPRRCRGHAGEARRGARAPSSVPALEPRTNIGQPRRGPRLPLAISPRLRCGLQQATEAAAAVGARRAALDRQRRDLLDRRVRLEARLADSERQREMLLAATVSSGGGRRRERGGGARRRRGGGCSRRHRRTRPRVWPHLSFEKTTAFERARDADRVLAPLEAEAKALSRILAPGDPVSGRRASADIAAARPGRVRGGGRGAVRRRTGRAADSGGRRRPGESLGCWLGRAGGARPGAAARRRASVRRTRSRRRRGWRDASRIPAGSRTRPRAGDCSRFSGRGKAWWTATAGFGAGTALSGSAPVRAPRPSSCASATGSTSWPARSPRRRQAEQHAAAEAARRRAEREIAAAAERAAAGQLRAAEERLARARQAEAELSRRGLAAEAKLAALVEAIEKIGADLAELETQISEADGCAGAAAGPDDLPRGARQCASRGRRGAAPRCRGARRARSRVARGRKPPAPAGGDGRRRGILAQAARRCRGAAGASGGTARSGDGGSRGSGRPSAGRSPRDGRRWSRAPPRPPRSETRPTRR